MAEGDTLSVTGRVTNTGDTSESQTITLAENGTQVDSTTVTLAGGESTTVTLKWTTAAGDAGDHAMTVASANDSDSTVATVLEPGTFVVSIDSAPDRIMEDDPLPVTATVENVGTGPRSDEVMLSVNGTPLAKQSVSLAAGDSTTVRFSPSTGPIAPGVQPVTVAATDDSASTTVEIVAKDRAIPSCPGSNAPPTDPDGDGHYEDVNGDGEVTSQDRGALMRCRGSTATEEYPLAFDFDDDGDFDVDDIRALAREIRSR